MDTNKVVIGNVYQINKWEREHDVVNYNCTRIKEKALLFKQSHDVFMDVETNLLYNVDIDSSRQLGDVVVFSESIIPFNPFLKEKHRCNDIPVRNIVKTYKKVKSNIIIPSNIS